jgi:hypothetical protein
VGASKDATVGFLLVAAGIGGIWFGVSGHDPSTSN